MNAPERPTPPGAPGKGGPQDPRRQRLPWMVAALALGLAVRLTGWLMLRRAFFCGGAPGFEDAVHQARIQVLIQSRFAEEALPAGSPLYPHLAALLTLVSGGHTGGLLLLQTLVGWATIPLVAWALAPRLSPRARWIAALVYAVHPLFTYYGMRLQPVVFAIPLLLAGLRLTLLAPERSASRNVMGGLLLGFGFLLKPLLFLAVAAAAVIAQATPSAAAKRRPRLAGAALLAGAFLLLPALICAHHASLPNGGPTWNWTDALGFHQTLQPATWGTARTGTVPAWHSHEAAISGANEAMERELSLYETAGFYRGRALQALLENPLAFVGQVFKRALLMVSGPETPDPVSARFVLRRDAVPLAWGLYLYPVLLALGVVGLWLGRRSPESRGLHPLLWAVLAAGLLGTYSAAARVFVLVALLPWIALALEALPAQVRGLRSSTAARWALAGGLGVLLLSSLDPAGGARRFERESEDLREAAGLLLRGGQDRRGATALLRKALQGDRSNPMVHADLGGLLAQEELPEAARQEYEAALSLDPGCAPALYGLSSVLRATNRNAEAESVMTALVSRHPNHPLYLNELATTQILQGRFAEARFLLRRALELSPLYQVALINLRAADEGEKRATAMAFPEEMAPAPDSDLMALSLQATNAWRARDLAAADSLTALALARFPDAPMAWYVRGMLLYQSKRFAEAAELLTRVVRAAPGRAMTAEAAARAWREAGQPATGLALLRESLARAADDANRARLERAIAEEQAAP